MDDERFEVRPFAKGDEGAVLALHNRAFDGHAPRSRAHWDWKFRANPLGATEIVVAMNGTDCAAVYAVVPHRAILDGEECRAGLQTDLAVAPEHRTGLGGSRLILAVGKLFRERFVTPETKIEWGFPEPQLQRVCTRHLGVGVLRDVVFLAREPTVARELSVAGVEVRSTARFDADVDELWRACRAETGTGTVRDAAYLGWRYADHPDVRHTVLEARDAASGGLRGIAVLRDGGWDERLVSLMDWLVPFQDEDAAGALVARALDETGRRGREYLTAWFPTPSREFHRFQREYGFFAKSTPFQESYRSWVPGIGRRWLDEHWYQTMGDIDFF